MGGGATGREEGDRLTRSIPRVRVFDMSRVFVDQGLETWEVFASGGLFGLPEHPKIVLHPMTQPGRRARYVHHEGDNASAQRAVRELSDQEFWRMLGVSTELD